MIIGYKRAKKIESACVVVAYNRVAYKNKVFLQNSVQPNEIRRSIIVSNLDVSKSDESAVCDVYVYFEKKYPGSIDRVILPRREKTGDFSLSTFPNFI